MKMLLRLGVIVLILLLAAGLFLPSAAAAEDKFGGAINIGIASDPANLNPLTSNDRVSSWLLSNMYPTLLMMDEEGTKVPYIAEDIEVSEDGLTVTVTLVEGLEWSDGTPLTSADVRFTAELMKEEQLQWQADSLNQVESIETPDELTIIFNLVQPYPGFVGVFGFWQRIVPEHVFSQIDNVVEFENREDVVSAGPFNLDELQEGQYYVLERVDEWFLSPEGKPYIEEIIYHVYPDVNTMVMALQSGEIDLTATNIPPSQADILKQRPEFTVVQTPSLGFVYIGLKYDNEFLNDRALRQAIAHGIDRDEIINIALEGDGKNLDTPVSPVYEGEGVVNPEAKMPEFSIEAAQEALAAAGYEDTDDSGILNSPITGEDVILELVFDGADIYLRNAAQVLESNFNDMGLKLELRPLDRSTYLDIVTNQGNFDINLGGWGIIDEPSDAMYTLYHSDSFLNFSGLESDELDRVLEKARFASNKEEELKYVHEFQEVFLEELPVITLYYQLYNFAYSNDFEGFSVYPSDLRGLMDPQNMSRIYLAD
ncbi:MAG: ABC transporter substrate-binding protein [Bacillota bacterium]